MIQIKAHQTVITALQNQFPDSDVEGALNSYLNEFSQLIEKSIQEGTARYFGKVFEIPLLRLHEVSTQLRPGRKRVSAVLKSQDLLPYEIFEKGSNISEKISLVSLDLRNYQFQIGRASGATRFRADGTYEIDPNEQQALIGSIESLSGLNQHLTDLSDEYQLTEVNCSELAKFIFSLQPDGLDRCSNPALLRQVLSSHKALLIADYFGGVLPNLIKGSPFGRTYLAGLSIQSMPKAVRQIALSPSVEYDIKSSVFSWQLAAMWRMRSKDGGRLHTLIEDFPMTFQMITDKEQITKQISDDLADQVDNPSDADKLPEKIKQALTALSFGAQLKKAAFYDGTRFRVSSLREIFFHDPDIAEAFQTNGVVVKLVAERRVITNHLKRSWKSSIESSGQLIPQHLQSKSGALNTNKLMAHLYQHFETKLMDRFSALIEQHSKCSVRARIHDAVVISDELNETTLQYIISLLKADFDMPILRINISKNTGV